MNEPGHATLRIQILPRVTVRIDSDLIAAAQVRDGEALVIGQILELMEFQWKKNHGEQRSPSDKIPVTEKTPH